MQKTINLYIKDGDQFYKYLGLKEKKIFMKKFSIDIT